MTTMTLDQAKTHLDDLLARAAAGEEVVIVRDDGTTFSVTPVQSGTNGENGPDGSNHDTSSDVTGADPPKDRRELIDSMKGKIWIAPDFDEIPEGFEPYLGDDYERGDSASKFPRRSRGSYGIVKGQIWMAPDFDEIPEGFEPYLGDDRKAE